MVGRHNVSNGSTEYRRDHAGPLDDITTKQFRLYTLHFATPVSGKQHYTGIAHHKNFGKRLDAHLAGHGSSLTARVAAKRVPMLLVDVVACEGFEFEARVKKNRHARDRCSICTPRLINTKMQPVQLLYRDPQPGAVFSITDWNTPKK